MHAEALREAEARYRTLFDNVPTGLYRSTPAGQILDANRALVQLLGYRDRETLLSAGARQLYVNPEHRRQWQERLGREGVVSRHEVQLRRWDGSTVWIEENSRVFRDGQGRVLHYEGSVEDISTRKRAAEELREAQKMEAIGRLAGGIAHDFNNLLGIIRGVVDLMAQRIAASDGVAVDIARIREATERASTLTHQLLAVGRRQILQPHILDLNSVIDGMGDILRSLIGERVDMRLVLAQSIGRVKVDPGQLEQVILNLVMNARDARPDGGVLTIETGDADLDGTSSGQAPPRPAGSYVMLSVSDTGTGMDAKTRSRVFEPFFTTKPRGQGTGLGLSTVYGIISQSRGCLSLHSRTGRGTTFKIYLPRLDAQARQVLRSPQTQMVREGSETILVVEDEEALRDIIGQGLESCGYRVLTASDGRDAYKRAARFEGRIDLLLSDFVMPQMNGTNLAGLLRQARPDLRVLLMSGYSDSADLRDGLIPRGAGFLQKPFSLAELTGRVREMLDSSAAADPEALPPAAGPPSP